MDTNGIQYFPGTIKNGTGSINYFYTTGVLYYSQDYLNGDVNGIFKKYYPSGRLEVEGIRKKPLVTLIEHPVIVDGRDTFIHQYIPYINCGILKGYLENQNLF